MASSKSDTKILVRQDYDLPKTIQGLTSLIREIVEQGESDRIVIDQEHIRAWVWVEKNDLMEDQNVVTLDTALSSSEFIEYSNPNDDKTPAEVLLHIMHLVQKEKLHPVCWVTGFPVGEGILSKWLGLVEVGLPSSIDSIFGVKLERLKSIPEETLVLCSAGTKDADIKDITLVVKTVVEPWVRRNNNDSKLDAYADRSRDHSEERSERPEPVEGPSRGDGGIGWSPASVLRSRLNGSG